MRDTSAFPLANFHTFIWPSFQGGGGRPTRMSPNVTNNFRILTRKSKARTAGLQPSALVERLTEMVQNDLTRGSRGLKVRAPRLATSIAAVALTGLIVRCEAPILFSPASVPLWEASLCQEL